jgi:hypothetical protein
VALTSARTDPPRAEQIARSLLDQPHKLGELALAVAAGDGARAERIAATIRDDYMRAIVAAALAVQAASDHAKSLLHLAEQAANGFPARLIEVAVVTARADPARAEQIARSIDAGPEIIYLPSAGQPYRQLPTNGQVRSAPYWRARALTNLAIVAEEGRAEAYQD